MDLEYHRIKISPAQTAYYVQEYITKEEEKLITDHVTSAPKPKWTQLANRRLQNWGGIPHPHGMIAEKLPEWLLGHTTKIGQLGVFGKDKAPNHVLVNEYCPGQGIMPHSDGPIFYPTVTTISCGSHTVLDFYKSCDTSGDLQCRYQIPDFSLLLERRSLLVLQDELYNNYLHAIAEVERDVVDKARMINVGLCAQTFAEGEILHRQVRVSLTIRHVARTSKFKINLGK